MQKAVLILWLSPTHWVHLWGGWFFLEWEIPEGRVASDPGRRTQQPTHVLGRVGGEAWCSNPGLPPLGNCEGPLAARASGGTAGEGLGPDGLRRGKEEIGRAHV